MKRGLDDIRWDIYFTSQALADAKRNVAIYQREVDKLTPKLEKLYEEEARTYGESDEAEASAEDDPS